MRAMTENENLQHRRIRSFVLRQGRLTKGQERALEMGWPKFGIDYTEILLDLNEIFRTKREQKNSRNWFWYGRCHSANCTNFT